MDDFDKENVMPATSSDPLSRSKGLSPSPKKAKKGRSKSIGPGSLEESAPEPKISAKDRRKSAFVPATKSILSKNEDAERAARRKTMVNRRVSFAPEATLHTWDIVIDTAQDQTTSTDSNDSTRRASGFNRDSSSPAASSEVDAAQEAEDRQLLSPPESQHDGKQQKQSRRSSGIPPMNFNNPDDAFTTNDFGGSDDSGSDEEAGEEEEEGDADGESDDGESTAMSLDVGDATMRSEAASEDSTSSSLTARLQAAAEVAGTRGIEYDEFGDDVSMEIAENEVTNAIQPWMQQNQLERIGSAGLDQENVNPFSPAFKAEVVAQEDDENNEEEDMSMDVTRAVGGIMKAPRAAQAQSSPAASDGDGTMDLTQAVGKITGQKRRRSTTDSGSPAAATKAQSKRRRSSVARSSVGDETMDLTMAYGGIQNNGSLAKPDRRRSLRSRRSSGMVSDTSDATMDMTMAVGGIRSARQNGQDESFNENEELSMELTHVLGGIRDGVASTSGSQVATPQAQSPSQGAANVTPKDQDRFKNTPDLGARQLLMPLLQKEAQKTAEKQSPINKARKSLSPMRLSASPARRQSSKESTPTQKRPVSAEKQTTSNDEPSYPVLPQTNEHNSPVRTPTSSPKRRQSRRDLSSEQRQFDQQLQVPQQSPMADEQQRSSPLRHATTTPERPRSSNESKNLNDTIGMMATPRKEALKTFTPKKQTPAKQASPLKAITPRGRPTPRSAATVLPSPVRRLNEDLQSLKSRNENIEPVGLQDFLSKANIRFMDLTTTKRRLTTAVPPSQAKGSQDVQAEQVDLESGVVAAACTIPELELYQHACHELKRFTKEGKRVIGELEQETRKNQPPLLQVYMNASPDMKMVLDAAMRDMKTNARLRSKEMWYAWRSQLLEELMGGLSKIGEGLIQDVEILTQSEEVLDEALPPLVKQHEELQQEADLLEKTVNAIPEGDKEQLHEARENLVDVNNTLAEKRKLLDDLRRKVEEQDNLAEHLQDSKLELTAAIQESNRVREACRGVSIEEVSKLKESWDKTAEIAESERRLSLETLTTSRITSDEKMEVIADVLLPKVRTKVRARFEIEAKVNLEEGVMEVEVEPQVEVVYGELYDERNMTKYLKGLIDDGWDEAVRGMWGKLVAKGVKGERK
ncbi:Kinetochore protein spc7 [Pseudocercospora fuligena]|uniref:Kinetochore protein spc7 n=1 Tax=Pseudocercospora fuligena TaxID=685502 RepID=A0A8H6VFQ0_9PEZI|nr:Kinetochore protein spc7 [Pseudocercospora fuligena]